MSDLLSALSPSQRLAAQTINGPLLVIAGAGTGKTRTLVHRLAYLVAEARIPAEKLLAITFTTRAADEMRERIAALCSQGIDLSGLFVGTIHALCCRILQGEGRKAGFIGDFEIISPSDQATVIRSLVPRFFPAQQALSLKKYELILSREKNERAGKAAENNGQAVGSCTPFLRAYQEILEREALLDFDDLIINTLAFFKRFALHAQELLDRFAHISVDEYQDVNTAQYLLIRELAGTSPNLCAVGDADQAIYAFRGAQVKNFLNFQQDFPDAKIVKLEENYRSNRTIITAAQRVIEKNRERIDKKLVSLKPAGARIELCEMLDERQEARFIASETGILVGGTRFETLERSRQDEDLPDMSFKDIAVLYRLHAQARCIKEALEQAGIPVRVAAGRALYGEPDVEVIIAVLELLKDQRNDLAAAAVLENTVKGIGPKTATALTTYAQQRGTAVIDCIRNCSSLPEISADRRARLDLFLELLGGLAEKAGTAGLDQLIKEIAETLFCAEAPVETEEPAAARAEENLLELVTASMPFCDVPAAEGIPLFLRKIAMLRDGEQTSPQQEAVTLLTVHGAKGLEFPVVFIAGLEEGLFPYNRGADADAGYDPEEERRLFYVGMTRAKEKLYLLHSRSRFLFGERRELPGSGFLTGIPAAAVNRYTDPLLVKKMKEKLEKNPKQMRLFSD
jgi:DNA helicase II / ATP-dependent DNA helicase PcrA